MIERERALWIYETMQRIRAFEFQALNLFENNLLRGSVHLYIGQEAVAATVCSRLSDEDYIASTHRGHGHCIAKGARMDLAMAELMGKATGYCKGRSGSMHIADFDKGNLGANAIVGGGIPIATGAALSIKLRKRTGQVAVSFFGDGASNEGTFHESLNMAGVWKLPIIYVCENNGYGISVPAWQSTAVKDIAQRGAAYEIPGITADGNDVEAIDQAMETALSRARAGKGATLVECKTYRWMGHWTGDPQNYRTREEVAQWKAKDPIKRFGERLNAWGYADAAELEAIGLAAKEEAEAAARFALESPEPDPAQVLEDVFYEEGK